MKNHPSQITVAKKLYSLLRLGRSPRPRCQAGPVNAICWPPRPASPALAHARPPRSHRPAGQVNVCFLDRTMHQLAGPPL